MIGIFLLALSPILAQDHAGNATPVPTAAPTIAARDESLPPSEQQARSALDPSSFSPWRS